MRAHDLKERAVVTLVDAAKVGTVADLLFDPLYQRVVGLLLKEVPTSDVKVAVPRARITAIGPDAVTLQSADEFAPIDRFPELRNARSLEFAYGTKVVTEGGELLGILDGFELDDEAREVRACILASPLLDRLLSRQNSFTPQHIRQVGESGLMVVDNAVMQDRQSEESAQPEEGAPTPADTGADVARDQ